jgi:hypothetical protein
MQRQVSDERNWKKLLVGEIATNHRCDKLTRASDKAVLGCCSGKSGV